MPSSTIMLLAVPLLGIVRVDLWAVPHVLRGEPVGFLTALRGFIIAVAILWGVTFATNIVVGRFFCGWGCPVGYVSRLGEDVQIRKRHPLRRLVSHGLGAAFVAVFVGAIMLWWVDWRVMLDGSLQARAVTGGLFAVLWAGGFMYAFVWRFGFCRSACPIGLYYRYVTSSAPIGIVFRNDPTPCIECGACEKICPVDIDPKALGQPMQEAESPTGVEVDARYGDAECIRCGDCIEACRMIFKAHPEDVPPLRFGAVSRKPSVGAPTGAHAGDTG